MNKLICHMTHIRNLPGILDQDGLWCDAQAKMRGLTQQGIGHSHIKERRACYPVYAGPRGHLCDYVPFYFHHHSPMLYAIYRGGVGGYTGGQGEVIYLTSSTDVIAANNVPFVFTDGHAVLAISSQYDNLNDLTKLDWSAVEATYWTNTNEDGDNQRRKQAEFLVYNFLPWQLVTGIVVKTQSLGEIVASHLKDRTNAPKIHVLPAWYY